MIKTRLMALLSQAKKYIIQNVFWQWAALLAQIAAVFSAAGLLESAFSGKTEGSVLRRTVLILVLSVCIRFVCDRMAARASYAASVDVKRILRKKIYEKLLRLGASYREQTATSEIVQMSSEGVEQLEIYFGKYFPQLFYSLLGSCDVICGTFQSECESKCSASPLCAADPTLHCCGAEDRQTAS